MYRDEFTNWQAAKDARLVDINAEIKHLRTIIDDKLWCAKDASIEQAQLERLKKAWADGSHFHPKF